MQFGVQTGTPLEGDGIVPSPPTVKGDRHEEDSDQEGDEGHRQEAEAQGRDDAAREREAVGEEARIRVPAAGNGGGPRA